MRKNLAEEEKMAKVRKLVINLRHYNEEASIDIRERLERVEFEKKAIAFIENMLQESFSGKSITIDVELTIQKVLANYEWSPDWPWPF